MSRTKHQVKRHTLRGDARFALGEHVAGVPDPRCACGHGALRHLDGGACIALFNYLPCMCKQLRPTL